MQRKTIVKKIINEIEQSTIDDEEKVILIRQIKRKLDSMPVDTEEKQIKHEILKILTDLRKNPERKTISQNQALSEEKAKYMNCLVIEMLAILDRMGAEYTDKRESEDYHIFEFLLTENGQQMKIRVGVGVSPGFYCIQAYPFSSTSQLQSKRIDEYILEKSFDYTFGEMNYDSRQDEFYYAHSVCLKDQNPKRGWIDKIAAKLLRKKTVYIDQDMFICFFQMVVTYAKEIFDAVQEANR